MEIGAGPTQALSQTMNNATSAKLGFTRNPAFSLIELLVVMGVIVLLVALSAPTLVDIARGQGMRRAVSELSGVLEEARINAMATSTWTWVGFSERVTDGSSELVVAVVASLDGSSNLAANNVRLAAKPIRLENVKIVPNLTAWADGDTDPLRNSTFSFTENVAGTPVTFNGTVLGFSPRGEATVDPAVVPSWIELGLRETRGTTEIPEKTASIRVSGFSGQQNVNY